MAVAFSALSQTLYTQYTYSQNFVFATWSCPLNMGLLELTYAEFTDSVSIILCLSCLESF